MIQKHTIAILLVPLFIACQQEQLPVSHETDIRSVADVSLTPKAGTGRWYTEQDVSQGQVIFRQYCAACHGQNAEQTVDWKTLDANGNYPPPPLNGTAHAWHHPLAELEMVIKEGGEPFGGVMPPWGNVLTDADIVKVIASFQQYWTDEIYDMWLERERLYREYRMGE